MERMLHRKLVGMNRVGELQGGMFFWVGGACNGGGGVGSGFIMRQAVLCNRASERGRAFFSTQQRCGISFVFGRRPLSLLLLSLFLRQRQLRINAGIAQMSCLTVLFVIISRAAVVSCRQCWLLIPEEAIPPSLISSLSHSLSQLEIGRRNGQHEIFSSPLSSLCLIP